MYDLHQFQYAKKSRKSSRDSRFESRHRVRKSESTPNLSASVTQTVLATTQNLTCALRSQHIHRKKEIYDKEELVQKRKQLQIEMRQIEMRESHPAWQKLQKYQVVDHSDIEAKKSQRVSEAREMEDEYRMELEKMMIRVQNQPTLFERQSAVRYSCLQNNAQSSADTVLSKITSKVVQIASILRIQTFLKTNYFDAYSDSSVQSS